MNGTTFPRMSSDATPGYPAPLTACIVLTKIASTPNRSTSGFSAITSPIAEQFGFVTMYPPDSFRHVWFSTSARCSAFTSGITSGTDGSIRNALELVITAHPAAANLGSSSRAISASSAAKITRGAPSGVAGETGIAAIRSGSGVSSFHRTASPYGFPLDRSLAASQPTSNHGWCSSSWINRCPTIPVAPKIPIFCRIPVAFCNTPQATHYKTPPAERLYR